MKKIILLLLFIFGVHAAGAKTHVVEVVNFEYVPDELSIEVGDTVHFQWIEGVHPTESKDGAWETFPMNKESTDYFLVLDQPGSYDYICTLHESLGMVGTIVVQGPSSVEELSADEMISIYPNPATEVLYLNYNLSLIDEISVYNLLGKPLLSFSPLNGTQSIDVSGLPNGPYYLVLKSGNDILKSKKFIKR